MKVFSVIIMYMVSVPDSKGVTKSVAALLDSSSHEIKNRENLLESACLFSRFLF